MTALNHYPIGDLTAHDLPAKTCPTCGATHRDRLYMTCDECRGVTIGADTRDDLRAGMLASLHAQNAAALGMEYISLDDLLAQAAEAAEERDHRAEIDHARNPH